MSLLTQASLGMSALLAGRQRNPAAAGAAASWEWPGQDARVARLMVRAAEAEQLATVQAARIRQLEAEIELLRGKTQPRMPDAAPGFLFSVPLGTGLLWCLTGEDRNWRGEPAVECMWINGEWVPTDEFNGPLGFDALDSAAARAEPRP